jgi:hypothetical protein
LETDVGREVGHEADAMATSSLGRLLSSTLFFADSRRRTPVEAIPLRAAAALRCCEEEEEDDDTKDDGADSGENEMQSA